MSCPNVVVPRTAIVPAAGHGTRFLPATKTVPKEPKEPDLPPGVTPDGKIHLSQLGGGEP